MKINILEACPTAGLSREFSFKLDAAALDGDLCQLGVAGAINIQGQICNTGTSFAVDGSIEFTKTAQCDRCLEEFSRRHTVELSERYAKDSNDGETQSFSGNVIDIGEAVRETIVLSQPLSNLCNLDCRGLCIKCGANLNKIDCKCDRHIVDPRLVALQKLLLK